MKDWEGTLCKPDKWKADKNKDTNNERRDHHCGASIQSIETAKNPRPLILILMETPNRMRVALAGLASDLGLPSHGSSQSRAVSRAERVALYRFQGFTAGLTIKFRSARS